MEWLKRNKWLVIIGVAILFIGIVSVFYKSSSTTLPSVTTGLNDQKNQELADYLSDVINFAHDGYLADNLSTQIDPHDIAGMMANFMEVIDDENQAISYISKYATSTDSTISKSSSIMVLSEIDVASKQQQALNLLRQISNGTIPADVQYNIAQVKVAQNKRNDSIILAISLFPYMTMDTSSIEGSTTASVGPLNPSSSLTAEQRTSVLTTLQMDFGSDLDSNKNDIFLLLAQEVHLLLTSPTYAAFHEAWLQKVSNVSN